MLRSEDAQAVAEILRQSPQAVFWPEASVKEVLEWKGSLGMAIEKQLLLETDAGDQ